MNITDKNNWIQNIKDRQRERQARYIEGLKGKGLTRNLNIRVSDDVFNALNDIKTYKELPNMSAVLESILMEKSHV